MTHPHWQSPEEPELSEDVVDAHARSFGSVAEAYDRGRPDFPIEAVKWLVGERPCDVLELGAGTGKLTRTLVELGHRVIATDPLPEMLAKLSAHLPDTPAVIASAEQIPAPSHSVDVVVCAQSFHWFQHDLALPEIARVLRPGGTLALVWNRRDDGIPWVRKLTKLIGMEPHQGLLIPLAESEFFGDIDEADFKFWQTHTAATLADLVRSRSSAAVMTETDREALVAKVVELYDSYGRGHDGMQMPYTAHCYRAPVIHTGKVEIDPPTDNEPGAPPTLPPPEDPGTLLIDFR